MRDPRRIAHETLEREREVRLTPAGEIPVEPPRWAWEGRIPLGNLTLLVGDPKEGKTLLAVWIAARLSRGQLPGEFHGRPVDVAFASAEDSWRTTLVPRLLAAGADLSRIHRVDLVDEDGEGDICLPDDVPRLEAEMRRVGARVLIVDPAVAFLAATVNTWRDADVRRVLSPLRRLADDLDAAVIGIVHWNKNGRTGHVNDRISGSKGVWAAARSVLVAAPHPDSPEGPDRVLVHSSCNLAPEAPALRYRIEGCVLETPERGPIPTARIVWGGTADVRKGDLAGTGDPEGQERREAKAFLRELLAEGPVPAKEVKREAAAAGIAWRTLARAKLELGVASKKERFDGAWIWSLPNQAGRTVEDGHEGCQYQYGGILRTGTGSFPQVRAKDATIPMVGTLREPPEEEDPPPEDLPPDDEPGNPDGAPLFDDGPLVEPPEDDEETAEEAVLEDVGGAGAPLEAQGLTLPRPPDPRPAHPPKDWREERLAALRPYVERYRRQFPNWRDEDIALNLGDFEPPPGFVGWTGHAVRVVMGEAEPPWTRS